MKSLIFHGGEYHEIEDRIKTFLNSAVDVLTEGTMRSPRAAGDAIQEMLTKNFHIILGVNNGYLCSEGFGRRAMADLVFTDHAGIIYLVDVKTHRLSTKFNMPNLTSVERLAKLYDIETTYFIILMIAYDLRGTKIVVENVHFVPIEFLSWDCLTLGALGWGQLQIANSNRIIINNQVTRRSWMLQMCDKLLEFYPKEIAKIGQRITVFESVKQKWVNRPNE